MFSMPILLAICQSAGKNLVGSKFGGCGPELTRYTVPLPSPLLLLRLRSDEIAFKACKSAEATAMGEEPYSLIPLALHSVNGGLTPVASLNLEAASVVTRASV